MRSSPAGLSLAFAVCGLAVAGLALGAAVPVTVLGLAIFGLPHLLLELRYVIGRFADRFTGRTGPALFLLLSAVVAARALVTLSPVGGRLGEVVAGHAVVAAGAWLWLRGRARPLVLAGVAASLVLALWATPWYFTVLTHLHNLVPVAFLWDWARRIPDAQQRLVFRSVHLLWALVLPALIVAGAFDGVVNLATGPVAWLVGDGAGVLAASAPPGASALVAARFCAAFALGQSMHYVVWIGLLPRFAPEATRAFERTFPDLAGRRFAAGVVVLGAAMTALFLTAWTQGRMVYSLITAYHVYLEFPLLVWLAFGRAPARASAFSPGRAGAPTGGESGP
ncbi:MAG: hypothetical protein HZY73_16665 [Micropruina sp.]|nr:MAG: hypothetical protein HZY73_16665 [Micropruina sp.]